MSHQRPVGVVLTGGASERMGVDKATLVVDGKPMAVRVGDALWEASCHPVECQGGDAVTIRGYGMDVFPDSHPGAGPLSAVLDALERHDTSPVVVAACDLVDLDAETVCRLIEAGAASGTADVAVATTGGDRHLVAWCRAGLVRRLAPVVEAGTRSFRGALSELDTLAVEVPVAAVRNLNTPSDVDARG